MKKKVLLQILYYIAWAIGLFAAAVLIYGIIKSLRL